MSAIISKQLFATSIGHSRLSCKRTLSGYWSSAPGIKKLSTGFQINEGNETMPSLHQNVYGHNISFLNKRKAQEADELERQKQVVYSRDIWHSLIDGGVVASQMLLSKKREQPLGLQIMTDMMKFLLALVEFNKMKLEPFQLKAIRSNICSSGERLLGEELYKYVPNILKSLGLVKGCASSCDPALCSEITYHHMLKTFEEHNKRITAVIAPRRNGKSKAGKLFVTVNAVCERGARIVLLAHKIDASLLYKSEVMNHLHQMLDMKLAEFTIHTASNQIRLDFPDDSRSSFIYFVSGGINVSL